MSAIFLSASVPLVGRGSYHETANPFLIQCAVRELVIAVIRQHKIVWGGHPAITPMIWSICEDLGVDYTQSVVLYQSKFFEDRYPEENKRFGNELKIVYTSLHGTGITMMPRMLAAWGFTNITYVDKQIVPDGAFPTAPYPNPEEKKALTLGIEKLEETQNDLLIANDPDADRLAMGIPTPEGGWRMLTGDELGALFAAGLMARRTSTATPLLVTTVVSSQLLAAVAAEAGAEFCETLTGFKWLCRPGFAHPELDQVLAYEESIGYAVGGLCDKDGISAAVVMADLVRWWQAQGLTPQDVLDDLARRHGAHVTNNFSLRISGPGWSARLAAIAASVVADPPTSLAGIDVARLDQPADDVIRLFMANGDRVVIRPSGTEPKLKCYCEAVEPVADNEPPEAARTRARARTATFRSELEARLGLS